MLIYNANVETVEQISYPNGFVQVEGGKIGRIGRMEDCPPVAEGDVDAGGRLLLPGFVDAHCHLGLFPDGQDYDGSDSNELTDPVTPQLRAIDALYPQDNTFREAREGGVTTVLTGPGSGNVIAGQFAAVKTAGRWIDKMVLKAPAAMKFALGENPRGVYGARKQSPMTRMAAAALIRETLHKAQRYARALDEGKQPEYDAKLEALLPVVRGDLPAHFHVHRADDIATAVRIGEEFRLDYRLIHATEGYLVADILAEKGVQVIAGPVLTDRSKPELANLTVENPARLAAAGCRVAICTDHPEIPIQYLPLEAALCVRQGFDRRAALRAITLGAAEIAGVAHRVGSIAAGKDADLVLWGGHPFDTGSRPLGVWIDGVRVK